MHVILMGAQGSGKGTQAALIGPKLRLVKVATGDLFRGAIAEGGELGQRVKAIYDRGELIPDELTTALVRERLAAITQDRQQGVNIAGALFDGFPRNDAQARALDEILAEHGEAVTVVVEIDVAREDLIRRVAGRRVCTNCGRVYHIETNPPKQEGVCDICGGDVVQRDDDKPEPFRRRLAIYDAETAPVLDYYRGRGLLERVNGDAPIDDVTAAILDVISRRSVTAGKQ